MGANIRYLIVLFICLLGMMIPMHAYAQNADTIPDTDTIPDIEPILWVDTITQAYRICEGESITIHDTTYSEPGTYYYTYSEDTVYCYVISVQSSITHTTQASFNGSSPYVWTYMVNGSQRSEKINSAGTYERFYANTKTGCSDRYVLILTLEEAPKNVFVHTTTASVCYGESYTWRGRTLTLSGHYRDSVPQGSAEPDTIFVLNLMVWPQVPENVIHLYAHGANAAIRYNGQVYYKDTAVVKVFPSSHGCDSVVTAYLHFEDPIDKQVNLTGCLPEGVRFHNELFLRDTSFIYTPFGDTIYHVNIVLGRNETIIKNDTVICEEDLPFIWGTTEPDTIWTEGFHSHKERVECGCDVTWQINLRIRPSFKNTRDSIVVCERDILTNPVDFGNGVLISKDSVLWDCKGNYYHVIVRPAQAKDSTYYLCEGDSVRFGYLPDGSPRWLKKAGIYYDTVPSIAPWTDTIRGYSYKFENQPCDSITTLHLMVHHTKTSYIYRTIMDGDSTQWNGQWLYYTGVYDSISDLTDADSKGQYCKALHRLYLSVLTKQEATICDNEFYRFGEKADGSPRLVNKRGYYYDTIHNATNGCDSIIELTLHVNPTYLTPKTVHVADTMTRYIWPHTWYEDGVQTTAYDTLHFGGGFRRTLKTVNGCDSVDSLTIVVHPTYFIQEEVELVLPGAMTWHGITITEAGVYRDSLHTYQFGFDSVHQVTVTTHWEFSMSKTICDGDYYDFFGDTLFYEGEYEKSIVDTIFFLSLSVNPTSLTKASALITREDLPYIFNGRLLDTAGVYIDTLKNQYRCDSVVHFNLIVTDRVSAWDYIPLCKGSTLTIHEQVITKPGEYIFPCRSVTGMLDSLYRVSVYAAAAYDMPAVQTTIQEGDTVYYAGETMTEAGHYDFTLKTIHGCDSLLHLNISVRHFMADTICAGQKYIWRDSVYTLAGTYHDTVWSADAEYASYYTLQLATSHATTITSAEADELCADEASFDISFEYDGVLPEEYTLRFDNAAKRAGFKDIIHAPMSTDGIIHVEMPVFTELCYLEHTRYVRPDRYTMQIELDNGICGIYQSEPIEVLIKYPNWILEQNWSHVVAPLKPEYNGGYYFEKLEWYVNNLLQQTDSMGYLYNTSLKTGDAVMVMATRKGENYSIPSCPLIIEAATPQVNEYPVIVFPTQTSHQMPSITIQAPQDGRYSVFSTTGSLLATGNLQEGETHISLPAASGIYFVRTTQGTTSQTHKIILY